ncbi:MAG: hypothetical protein R2861_03615 [Desulfobacterales bacterium]
MFLACFGGAPPGRSGWQFVLSGRYGRKQFQWRSWEAVIFCQILNTQFIGRPEITGGAVSRIFQGIIEVIHHHHAFLDAGLHIDFKTDTRLAVSLMSSIYEGGYKAKADRLFRCSGDDPFF